MKTKNDAKKIDIAGFRLYKFDAMYSNKPAQILITIKKPSKAFIFSYTPLERRKRHLKLALRKGLIRFIDVITDRTIYYAVDSTDCDWSRSRYARKAINWQAYKKAIQDLYEDAEGPTYHWRITKQDYESFKSESRDLALEAFENGHPHTIHY